MSQQELDWVNGKGNAASSAGDINVQGSAAWLAWRGKGLGSSDAAVLLGWSPWKTIEQLLAEKRGHWKPVFGAAQRAAMDRGKELEPFARRWYEGKTGASFPDSVSTDAEHDFMRASFDGASRTVLNKDGSLGRALEIKAPNAKDHELAKAGFLPPKYVPQVQWLMMVGKLFWTDYVSLGPDAMPPYLDDRFYAIVPVKVDPAMTSELRRRALLFWDFVQNPGKVFEWPAKWEAPPVSLGLDLSRAEHPSIPEQEIEGLVAEGLRLQAEADAATARYEAVRERLKSHLGERSKLEVGEGVMEWEERKGTVDYSKVPQLKGVDLEPFRKAPTKAFKFRRRGPGR